MDIRDRSPMPIREAPDSPVPRREELGGVADSSRRRFLRQLATATGLALTGLPRLSHGQSIPIDFAKLDRHVPVASPAPAALADATAAPRLEEAAPAEEAVAPEAERTMAGEEEAQEVWVEENRALWVEPGYLLLIKWRRPAWTEAPVAALEGSSDAVQAFLAGRITSVDQIHNVDQLRPIENELAEMLRPVVAPAEIAVLHLDHDCTTVCASLDPSRVYPEPIELMGEMVAPEWE